MFLFSFGIWDIFYYVGLKAFLGWPASFLTWDILFLIPFLWTGPVLAPLLCSITMILISLPIGWNEAAGKKVRLGRTNWLLLITGSVLIFYSYLEDFLMMLSMQGYLSGKTKFSLSDLLVDYTTIMPDKLNWWVFALGELLIIGATILVYRRYPLHRR
jgi:hypothetical protein